MARDLSIFVDESGDCGGKARYYLLTLVIHDQADSISDKAARYEESLLRSDLPNMPFHSEPLLNGHHRSCFSMTEPEVSGSDPTTLQTRAELVQAFEEVGWQWGGRAGGFSDYQHFSASGG